MKFYGDVRIGEGGEITNAVIDSGTSDPSAAPNVGELFYRTDLNQLRVYNGTSWVNVAPVSGTGTVTSVALTTPSFLTVSGSPVTTAGTIDVGLANQTANTVFAGPTSGLGAVPSFRSLVAADIPALNYVTSVAATGSTGLTVGGSPITSSGTLTFTLGNELQALSGLSTTGFVRRIGSATYSVSNLTSGEVTTALGYTPVNRAGDTMTGLLTLSADPSSAFHAATKQYVDNVAAGLDPKQSVRAATTANITLSGEQAIDGVAAIAGNRVLVKNQSTASQNGIYVVASGAWSRSADFDGSPSNEVTSGAYCFVEEGTVNADTSWVLVTNDPITLGTTSLAFAQFSGPGTYSAGTGLQLTGTTFSNTGVLSVAGKSGVVTLAPSDLGSGAADSSTFLRGDGTWTNTLAGNFISTGTVNRLINTSGAFQIYKDATPSSAGRMAYNVLNADTLELSTYNGTAWNQAIGINTSAQVTVGPPTTGSALIINGSTTYPTVRVNPASESGYSAIQLNNAAGSRRLELLYVGTSAGAYGIAAGTVGINAGSTGLTLSTTDNARVTISAAGNVNVNLATSGTTLNVGGGNASGSRILEVGGSIAVFESASRNNVADIDWSGTNFRIRPWTSTGAGLVLQTTPSGGGTTDRLLITNNGNVAIYAPASGGHAIFGSQTGTALTLVNAGQGLDALRIWKTAADSFEPNIRLSSINADATLDATVWQLGLYFGANNNSGINFKRGGDSVTGHLGFYTANTERFTINQIGNARIVAAASGTTLSVASSSSTGDAISSAGRLLITGGPQGVGQTSPVNSLQLRFDTAANRGYIECTQSGVANRPLTISAQSVEFTAGSGVTFTPALGGGSVSSNGNWSFSAPNSGTTMVVNSNSGTNAIRVQSGAVGAFEIGHSVGLATGFYNIVNTAAEGIAMGTIGAGQIRFATNNTNRVIIEPTGAMFINGPTSGDPLTISGINGTTTLAVNAFAGTTQTSGRFGIVTATNNPRIVMTHTESTSLSALNFTYTVAGSLGGVIQAGGNSVMSFTTGGQPRFDNAPTTASAANAFLDSANNNALSRSTSSIRYKTDIVDVTEEEANIASALRPITYKSKAANDDPNKRHYGLIAEEVVQVDSKLVHFTKDEEGNEVPDGVQYERVVVLLLKKIQMLEARLNELEGKLQ